MTEFSELDKKVIEIKIKALDLTKEPGVKGLRHFGGSFSQAHILTALYKVILKPNDTFILSKGHTCSTWYPLLREAGFNPIINGHPQKDPSNGIDMTTGALGHGLPFALGVAFAKKLKNNLGKVYVLMGDGESQEGSAYEHISLASELKLDNLITIVDKNKIQGSGFVPDSSIARFKRAAESECYISEINGHDFKEIIPALQISAPGKPRIIIANTIKGKDVGFMENQPVWHSKAVDEEEYQKAKQELLSKLS